MCLVLWFPVHLVLLFSLDRFQRLDTNLGIQCSVPAVFGDQSTAIQIILQLPGGAFIVSPLYSVVNRTSLGFIMSNYLFNLIYSDVQCNFLQRGEKVKPAERLPLCLRHHHQFLFTSQFCCRQYRHAPDWSLVRQNAMKLLTYHFKALFTLGMFDWDSPGQTKSFMMTIASVSAGTYAVSGFLGVVYAVSVVGWRFLIRDGKDQSLFGY